MLGARREVSQKGAVLGMILEDFFIWQTSETLQQDSAVF